VPHRWRQCAKVSGAVKQLQHHSDTHLTMVMALLCIITAAALVARLAWLHS
jgi:hypothetical protein